MRGNVNDTVNVHASSTGKISANMDLPHGKSYQQHNGETVFVYQKPTGEFAYINVKMFLDLAIRYEMMNINGTVVINKFQDLPILIRTVSRGNNINCMFCFMWISSNIVTNNVLIKWVIGELTGSSDWDSITWKYYDQIPGIKNKGLGSQDSVESQAFFEGSRRWVEFLEQNPYKLMFPGQEAIGNQLYFHRSNNTDILTSNFEVADAMLAEEYREDKIIWPCFVQPKFDGKRMMTGLKNGEIVCASRGRKMAKSIPHINEQMMIAFCVMNEICARSNNGNIGVTLPPPRDSPVYWFDGELFNHAFSFQQIISAVNRHSVSHNEATKQMNYVIYDIIDDGKLKQHERIKFLQLIFSHAAMANCPNIKFSPTYLVNTIEEVIEYHRIFKAGNYEGTMLRTINDPYVQGKRKFHVMKIKDWKNEEWYICGAEEATGNQAGAVKWVISQQPNGQGSVVKAVPVGGIIGTIEARREQYRQYMSNPGMFINTVVTLEFFERHNGPGGKGTGAPRNPVIIAYNRNDH